MDKLWLQQSTNNLTVLLGTSALFSTTILLFHSEYKYPRARAQSHLWIPPPPPHCTRCLKIVARDPFICIDFHRLFCRDENIPKYNILYRMFWKRKVGNFSGVMVVYRVFRKNVLFFQEFSVFCDLSTLPALRPAIACTKMASQ